MKRLRLIYEQLEEAKIYLIRGSLFDLRLALILTDNVAELMMYNALQKTFSRDDSPSVRQHSTNQQHR